MKMLGAHSWLQCQRSITVVPWHFFAYGPLHKHGQAFLIGDYSSSIPENGHGGGHERTGNMLSGADHSVCWPLDDPYARQADQHHDGAESNVCDEVRRDDHYVIWECSWLMFFERLQVVQDYRLETGLTCQPCDRLESMSGDLSPQKKGCWAWVL